MEATAPLRRRRKRNPRTWRVMVISALISVPLALAIPVGRYFGWLHFRTDTVQEKATRSFDVVLSEAGVRTEGDRRYIAGTVKNNSASRYENVEVAFTVRDRNAAVVATVTAVVKTVEPNGTAPFQSPLLPEAAFRVALREINGTRR